MAESLRVLHARVARMRSDLDDGITDYWLQECARRVGRETRLFRETQVPTFLPGTTAATAGVNTDSITVTPSGGNNLIRVERVRICDGLSAQALSKGTWNAATNTPSITTGSAGASNNGWFYIVATAGGTLVDGVSVWNVGDVIQSNGSSWVRRDLESFNTIMELNEPTVRVTRRSPQENAGIPDGWSQDINNPTGVISFYPRSSYDLPVQVMLSYAPVGELLDIGTLPVEVEEAIVHGALSQVLMVPGVGQNLELAKNYSIEYKRDLANLTSISYFGYGGSPMMAVPNFTGRQRRGVQWVLR